MMLIIQRLYLREFLKLLSVLTIGLSLFFSIVGLIGKMDDFLPQKTTLVLLAWHVILTMPLYIHYLLPMAILLTAIFTFSQAVRRREITAIKASGGRMKRVLLPVVGIGVILTLFAFVLGEIVVPTASKSAQELKDRLRGKEKNLSFREGVLYMKGKGGEIVRISLYNPEAQMAQGITIMAFAGSRLTTMTEAEAARWTGSGWELTGVTVYDTEKGAASKIGEMSYGGIGSPTVLQADLWKPEEMTMPEIIRYNRRLNEAGFRNTKLIVDISSRLSYPLVNLFMLLLGIALSLESSVLEERLRRLLPAQKGDGKMGGGIISAGIGLAISLAYWFGYSLFLSLGYAGTIPPMVAPWIIPAAFGLLSFYLYRHIPE